MLASSRLGDSFLINSKPEGNLFIKGGGYLNGEESKNGKVSIKVGNNLLANLHPSVQEVASELFNNGHFRQAILDTYIALSVAVKRKSNLDVDNTALMRNAFSPKNPVLIAASDPGEQEGFMYLFAGAMLAIRNPKAHSLSEQSDPQRTLEWLSFASVLFKVLDGSHKL